MGTLLVGTAAIGRHLGISHKTAQRWIEQGRLPVALVPWRRGARTWITSESLLDQWIVAQRPKRRAHNQDGGEVSAHSESKHE